MATWSTRAPCTTADGTLAPRGAAPELIGPLTSLIAHVVARLRQLVTQDRRIVDSGHVQAFIHDDDELRAAILGLIGDAAATALSSALWITRPWWPT